jgi:arylformamidase
MMPLYRSFTTQNEIDLEYSPRLALGDERTDAYFRRNAEESERVRTELAHQDGVAFGPSPAEHLDIYPAAQRNAPVHVFIHGGYWRAFSSKDFAFVAEGLVANGITAVLVNYALCPAVRLGEIVRQCRAALAWTWKNAASFGADASRLTLSGHSAGGHLTAMMLATDWTAWGAPADMIKAALPISGLYDLAPFPHSFLQPVLQLDEAQVRAESPLLLPVRARCPVLVAVGGVESGEFHRQSEDYVAHLRVAGTAAEHRDLEGRDHFNVLDDLQAASGPLCAWLAARA